MDVSEVLKLADELMFASSSKYLDNLERSIVRGVCENKKYAEISEESGYSEGHVNDVAANLWKVFSSVLGKKVKKNSFKANIERQFTIRSSKDFGIQQISTLTLFSDINVTNPFDRQFKPIDRIINPPASKDIPDLALFYGRTQDLKLLKQ